MLGGCFMYMGPDEIEDRFLHRMTGNEASRIDVLAQLNGCQKAMIRKILEERGVPLKGTSKASGTTGTRCIDTALARKLVDEGASMAQIARSCGVSATSIERWMMAEHILPKRPDWEGINEAEARAMYAHGASDRKVAERYKLPYRQMVLWREYYGIVTARSRPKDPA